MSFGGATKAAKIGAAATLKAAQDAALQNRQQAQGAQLQLEQSIARNAATDAVTENMNKQAVQAIDVNLQPSTTQPSVDDTFSALAQKNLKNRIKNQALSTSGLNI